MVNQEIYGAFVKSGKIQKDVFSITPRITDTTKYPLGNRYRVDLIKDDTQQILTSFSVTLPSLVDLTPDNFMSVLIWFTKVSSSVLFSIKNDNNSGYYSDIKTRVSLGKYFVTLTGGEVDLCLLSCADHLSLGNSSWLRVGRAFKVFHHTLGHNVKSFEIWFNLKGISFKAWGAQDSHLTETYFIPFKKDLTSEQIMHLLIRGEKAYTFDPKMFEFDMIQCQSPNRLNKVKLGSFEYLESMDGKIKITFQKDPAILAVNATLEAITALNCDTKVEDTKISQQPVTVSIQSQLFNHFCKLYQTGMKEEDPVKGVLMAVMMFKDVYTETVGKPMSHHLGDVV